MTKQMFFFPANRINRNSDVSAKNVLNGQYFCTILVAVQFPIQLGCIDDKNSELNDMTERIHLRNAAAMHPPVAC